MAQSVDPRKYRFRYTVTPGQYIQLSKIAERYGDRFAEVWAEAVEEAAKTGVYKIVRVDSENVLHAHSRRNLDDMTVYVNGWWDLDHSWGVYGVR